MLIVEQSEEREGRCAKSNQSDRDINFTRSDDETWILQCLLLDMKKFGGGETEVSANEDSEEESMKTNDA